MTIELTKEEVSQLKRAIQDRIEVLSQFTGRSIEAEERELRLLREKLQNN
jgi:hypothetical protein